MINRFLLKQGMLARTMPKWGHWFWITLLLLGLPGSTLGVGPGGLNSEYLPDGGPHPFPVFISPEVAAAERLTIVTPSSVEKIPEMVASVINHPDRRELGYGRQLEIKPSAVNPEFQENSKAEVADPSDVSISQSVSVVSVKYSLSGDRRRLDQIRQLPDTSLPPPPPHTTTTSTTSTTATAAERVLPAIRALPQFEHAQKQQLSHASLPQTTTTAIVRSSTPLPLKRLYPLNEPISVQQQKPTNLVNTTTVPQTTTFHIQNVNRTTTLPTTTTTQTPPTTTQTPPPTTTRATSHFAFESNTQKFLSVPINHSLQKFEANVEDVRLPNELAPNITRSQKRGEEEEEYPVGDNQKGNSQLSNIDAATSTVRGEKALFTSFETIKQLRNNFEAILNTTLRTITAYSTTKTTASTTRHTTARHMQTTTGERPVTSSERTPTFPTVTTTITTTETSSTPTITTTSARTTTTEALEIHARTRTTTGPQKIYLQEVEEITDEEEPVKEPMQSKPLHSNSPTSRMLNLDTVEEKAGALPQTKLSNDETTEASNGKMVVEYLEEAELARSFPSTKWNVYEDPDGSWYLQKTATRSSPRPDLQNSESPLKSNTNNNNSSNILSSKNNTNQSDSYGEYEEVPRVVDMGESSLNLPDLGESDRDEEPYEKFMAEESGRSTSVLNESNMNEEYFDTKDDELTPTYDDKNYTEDVDTSPIEPRMLSTAQKPVDSRNQRRGEEVIDEWGQPKVRKPPTIDIATVVGITVGAFLFILIGTVGLGLFIYHEKYQNKPHHTLEDRFSSSDSDGSSVEDPYRRISQIDCVGFDTTRDTFCEEMYNLDNDSFLNSLETVNVPSSYWIHESRNCDSDV